VEFPLTILFNLCSLRRRVCRYALISDSVARISTQSASSNSSLIDAIWREVTSTETEEWLRTSLISSISWSRVPSDNSSSASMTIKARETSETSACNSAEYSNNDRVLVSMLVSQLYMVSSLLILSGKVAFVSTTWCNRFAMRPVAVGSGSL
jgi:hypothetical protein